MNEVQALLERQARWQRSLQTLSWPEKIRMAEAIRESVRQLRQVQPESEKTPSPDRHCRELPARARRPIKKPVKKPVTVY